MGRRETKAARASLSTDVAAVLRDGQTVIRRGFGLDQLANGARTPRRRDQLMASGLYALWCAAFETGRGGDGRAMVAPLPADDDGLIDACRGAILEGLSTGAQRLPEELAHDGQQVAGQARAARLKGVLESLEKANHLAGLARMLEWSLAPDLSDAFDVPDAVAIGRTLCVRQQVTQLHGVPAGREVDWVHLEFRHGGAVVARTDLPRAAAASQASVANAVLRSMGLRRFLSIHRFWERPVFWVRLTSAVVRRIRGALNDRRSMSLKSILREAAVEALLDGVAR